MSFCRDDDDAGDYTNSSVFAQASLPSTRTHTPLLPAADSPLQQPQALSLSPAASVHSEGSACERSDNTSPQTAAAPAPAAAVPAPAAEAEDPEWAALKARLSAFHAGQRDKQAARAAAEHAAPAAPAVAAAVSPVAAAATASSFAHVPADAPVFYITHDAELSPSSRVCPFDALVPGAGLRRWPSIEHALLAHTLAAAGAVGAAGLLVSRLLTVGSPVVAHLLVRDALVSRARTQPGEHAACVAASALLQCVERARGDLRQAWAEDAATVALTRALVRGQCAQHPRLLFALAATQGQRLSWGEAAPGDGYRPLAGPLFDAGRAAFGAVVVHWLAEVRAEVLHSQAQQHQQQQQLGRYAVPAA